MKIVAKREVFTHLSDRLRLGPNSLPNPFAARVAIICNIGKMTTQTNLEQMALAGMNIARFNLAKIVTDKDRDWFLEQCQTIRKIERKHKMLLGIMVDLAGPKLRLGPFDKRFRQNGGTQMVLNKGHRINLTLDQCRGDEDRILLVGLPEEMPRWPAHDKPYLKLGDDPHRRLLIVKRPDSRTITCEVSSETLELHANEGVTFVDIDQSQIRNDTESRKDIEDLDFLLERGDADYISVSFASPTLVNGVRARIRAFAIQKPRDSRKRLIESIWVIAKIETIAAVVKIDELLSSSAVDGIMIARGDLFQAIPPSQLPEVQLELLRKAREYGKPAIVATGFLEAAGKSRDDAILTRAEVEDIFHTVSSGADAIMLSETSAVPDPVQLVRMFRGTVLRAEAFIYSTVGERSVSLGRFDLDTRFSLPRGDSLQQTDDRFLESCICKPAIDIARRTGAPVIATTVTTGLTARLLAKYAPVQFILALCTKPQRARRILLCRGIFPILFEAQDEQEFHEPKLFHEALRNAIKELRIDRKGIIDRLRHDRYADGEISQSLQLLGASFVEGRGSPVVGVMRADFGSPDDRRERIPNTIHFFDIEQAAE